MNEPHAEPAAGSGQVQADGPIAQRSIQKQVTLALEVLFALVLLVTFWGCHTIPEGYVGAYWLLGRLLDNVTTPGLHFAVPIIMHWEPIQVTMQTDAVMMIPCGTKGGTMISFERIEVVNRLRKDAVYSILAQYGTSYDKTWIYDKVHHEINQFCSAHTLQEVYIDKFNQIDEIIQQALQNGCSTYAPGIDIIGVRVTKPRVPKSVLENYEAIENERTKVMVAEQHQRLVAIQADTTKRAAIAEAEQARVVAETRIRKELMEMEAKRNLTLIENQMALETTKYAADADKYRILSQAEANQQLHTPAYLSLQWSKALTNTTKVYFGPSLSGIAGTVSSAAEMFFGKMSSKGEGRCVQKDVQQTD